MPHCQLSLPKRSDEEGSAGSGKKDSQTILISVQGCVAGAADPFGRGPAPECHRLTRGSVM